MEYKEIKLLLFTIFCFLMAQMAKADNYRVLFANSKNIRIGNQIAQKGMMFNDNDEIVWTSENQALKVINLSSKKIMIIAKKSFDRKNAKSLGDYLYKRNPLSTRDYGEFVVTDTVFYLLDTLRINAGKHYSDGVIDEAVVIIAGDTIVTQIQKSKNKKEFILTRKIFGNKNPNSVYVDIRETDKQRNWQYYIYRRLRVEPLPFNAD